MEITSEVEASTARIALVRELDGSSASATYKLLLAVDEIVANVIGHGFEAAGLTGDISVGSATASETLIIRLTDASTSYDPHAHPKIGDAGLSMELADWPVGGLGINAGQGRRG